jgi:hypothetical protein
MASGQLVQRCVVPVTRVDDDVDLGPDPDDLPSRREVVGRFPEPGPELG